MIIYFVDIGLLGIAYLIAFIVGGGVLDVIATFILGPVRFVIYALFIFVIFLLIKKVYLDNSCGTIISKICGTILSMVGCVMRHGVTTVLFFAFLLDFTNDFNNGLGGMIEGTLGIVLGGCFLVMLIFAILFVDAFLGKLQVYCNPIIVGIINVIVSFIAMVIIQGIFLFENTDLEAILGSNSVLFNILTGKWFCESAFANWFIETFF